MSEKEQVAAAISRARGELDEALGELGKMPAFDPGVVAFSAHALNNYLSVAAGTVELLMLTTAEYGDEQINAWLDGLRHVTELMRHTVNQLISYSAPKEVKLRLLKWDLVPLVGRACKYYERVAQRKQIQITYDAADDVPVVWTDPVAVAAVLDNLLSNAIKYSPPGKNILVQVRGDSMSAVCRVRDEGPGLSAEDHSKLFQHGVRLTPQPTGGETSNGFGLAVAMELMGRLGGQIWCDSELGAGSCFSFRVPAYQEHGVVAEASMAAG
jgi:signal transduction histidine kinase